MELWRSSRPRYRYNPRPFRFSTEHAPSMPIYEYQCDKCRHHLEALQKYSDKPLRECPECGKHALRRLMSAPRFRLAGSGWYETDFKSDNESKRNLVEKEKGETPAAAASTGDSSGDKPAAPAKE